MNIASQFHSSPIRYKLLSGFLLVVILFAGFGSYLVITTSRLGASMQRLNYEYQHLRRLSELELANAKLADSVKAFILTRNPKWEVLYEQTSIVFDRIVDGLLLAESDPEKTALLAEFEEITDRMKGTELLIIAKTKSGDVTGAIDLFDYVYEDLQSKASRLLNDVLVQKELTAVDKGIQEASVHLEWIRRSLAFLILIVLAIVIAISFGLASAISRPLKRLVEAARSMSEGSLGVRVSISSIDEIVQLAAAFNDMADRLHDSHEGLERQVAQRTSELSTANEQLKDEVAERARAEAEVNRLAREHATLAEIGRIMTSSLYIDQVYERFAMQVRRLIPFDRIDIVTTDLERDELCVEYTYGVDVGRPGHNEGTGGPSRGPSPKRLSAEALESSAYRLTKKSWRARFPFGSGRSSWACFPVSLCPWLPKAKA